MKRFVLSAKEALLLVVFVILLAAVTFTSCSPDAPDIPEIKTIDMTFDVVKIGRWVEEGHTLQLHITGQYTDYQSQEDVLELDIEDFDTFTNIRMREESNFVCFKEQQRGCVYFETERSDRTYTETLRMYFSENFDRVILEARGEILYIGSGSEQYTPQECVSYFESNSEDWDFVESVNIDTTIDVFRVNSGGREIETVQLTITGYYRNYILEEGKIYLHIDLSTKDIGSMMTADNTEIWWYDLGTKNVAVGLTALGGYNIKENSGYHLSMAITDELDRFAIWNEDEDVFLIGSVSGKYTSREIIEYINNCTDTGITLPEA